MLRTTFLTILMTVTVNAQETQLGRVEVPTSGSPAARAHFLRGLAALRSLRYEGALERFRESTKVDPEFMMGYWGEAMAYSRPLWSEQDRDAGRRVFAKFKGTPTLAGRQRA